jgi:hypothetical protein
MSSGHSVNAGRQKQNKTMRVTGKNMMMNSRMMHMMMCCCIGISSYQKRKT